MYFILDILCTALATHTHTHEGQRHCSHVLHILCKYGGELPFQHFAQPSKQGTQGH